MMNDFTPPIPKFLRELEGNFAARYFPGRYYFSVETRMYLTSLGLTAGRQMNKTVQRKLQADNITSLFHEYIHYIHEISTLVGSISLNLDIGLKSIFSHYFDKALTSSLHEGIDKSDKTKIDAYAKFYWTNQVVTGEVIQGTTLLQVLEWTLQPEKMYIPVGGDFREIDVEVPLVTMQGHVNGAYTNTSMVLGRFFLYEGLAYELDRILDQQVNRLPAIRDVLDKSEYTVVRSIARFIIPNIDTYSYLTLASLSLSYANCGFVFMDMLREVKAGVTEGLSVKVVLQRISQRVSQQLLERLEDFNDGMDEIAEVFRKRNRLFKAFTIIADQAKKGYLARCEHPSFEVDMIYEGQYEKLMEVVPLCDYMYAFMDKDEYDRDYLGTASFEDDDSQALKVVIGYDHYQKSHLMMSTEELESKHKEKCPFYTCCNLQLRSSHPEICNAKPWRIFEVSAATDHQYCWYGQAVAEFKGHNES